MIIDKLFEKIRKEEVALFVGSGLSLYAGFNSANDLRNKILALCQSYCSDESEKESLKTKNLEDIADCLIRYNNGQRLELNKLIIEEYKKIPEATYIHDLLGRIPHFEHIFTTNYDTLIEDAMQNRCSVICRESDFSYQSNEHPKVYKVHGDVNSLDNIIIAKRDYARSITNATCNLIWNRFKDIAASKDILFIGYSFEDSNIWEIFEKLKLIQNNERRQKFIICHSVAEHQKNRLKQEGFNCFELSGENFLNQLNQVLKDYAVADLEDKKLRVDTFRKFLAFHDRNVIIKTNEQKVTVEKILGPDGEENTNVKFTLPNEVHKEFMKFNMGETKSRNFKFSQDDFLSLEMRMGDYKLALNENSISSLYVKKIPLRRKLTIESDDDNINIQDIDCEQYSFKEGSELEFQLSECKFLFSLTMQKAGISVKFDLDIKTIYKNTNEGLNLFKLLDHINKGNTLNFYFDNAAKPAKLTANGNIKYAANWNVGELFKHFTNLKKLEKQFEIRFENIDLNKINDTTIYQVNFLCDIINNGFAIQPFDKPLALALIMQKYDGKFREELGIANSSFVLIIEDEMFYKLYNCTIGPVYFLIEVIDYELKRTDEHTLISSKQNKLKHSFLSKDNYELYKLNTQEVYTAIIK